MLRSDLVAVGNDLLDAFSWILAQTSLVQTKTINMVLTEKPMTVITKLIPEEIMTSNKNKPSFFFYLSQNSLPIWHDLPNPSMAHHIITTTTKTKKTKKKKREREEEFSRHLNPYTPIPPKRFKTPITATLHLTSSTFPYRFRICNSKS